MSPSYLKDLRRSKASFGIDRGTDSGNGDAIDTNSSVSNKNTFMPLPPEIRNMVYSLLLIQDSPIPICSPRRWVMNEDSITPTASFHNLMLVNKQIHAEVYTVFYSLNTFSIGNGDYGSSRDINIHGLKSFIRRVPAQYIECIPHLRIMVYLRKRYSTPSSNPGPWPYLTEYGIGSMSDAIDLQAIGRAVVKHFKGVEVLSLESCIGGRDRMHDEEARVCRERSLDEIAEALNILLKHPRLKELNVVKRNFMMTDLSQLEEAVEIAVAAAKGSNKISVRFGTDL